MKKNIVRAKGVSGIYKDKEIEVRIGKDSAETSIKVNGELIENVFGIHIHMRADEPTTLIIEKYAREGLIND